MHLLQGEESARRQGCLTRYSLRQQQVPGQGEGWVGLSQVCPHPIVRKSKASVPDPYLGKLWKLFNKAISVVPGTEGEG